ncbi:alpha/beta hydrolase [Marinimicrobium alkaliphilum]|uniref:alpha/beta hydrolase n=1 Tax=Marinimicrobium alkaliphilum TaxID=2202654 RepID=UPI000DB9083B|nr:alpha/beta hydrolase [Marinimicrobium alkaliphilum]
MLIDVERLQQLAAALPPLTFDPAADRFGQDPLAQTYLEFYDLPGADPERGLVHGFGKLPLGGFDIACHYWLPARAKATLVVVHGYFDHIGYYNHLIDFALAQGYGVLAFDLPGHGLSSGEPAAIDRFERYAEVLDALLDAAEPHLPGPLHAVGQSTGGTTLLIHQWLHRPRFDRVALLAPLLLPKGWALSRITLCLLGRWMTHVPRVFVPSSHDDDFNHFQAQEDPLQSRQVSVAWVKAMKAWDARFRDLPDRDKPLLVVQGTGDTVVDWRYNLNQISGKLPNAEIRMIDDARHHLVKELPIYRDAVFAHLARWLEG